MYIVASLCVSKLSSSRPVHPKHFSCLFYVAQEMEKYINPFILVVHYNVSIFRAVDVLGRRSDLARVVCAALAVAGLTALKTRMPNI